MSTWQSWQFKVSTPRLLVLQIQSIQQKYEQIETDLRANREKAKHDITKYLDEEAGVKMDELQTELLKFDAKLKDIHMVSG